MMLLTKIQVLAQPFCISSIRGLRNTEHRKFSYLMNILPYDMKAENKIAEKTCEEFMPFEALTKALRKGQVIEKIEFSIIDATRPKEYIRD